MGAGTRGHWWKFYSSSISQASTSHPLIGPQPALGISAKVAKGVIRGWTSRKLEEYWQSSQEQRQGNEFFKRPAKRAGELLNLSRNQPRIIMRLLPGHYHLKGHLFKLVLEGSLGWDRCKRSCKMVAPVLCDCEALVVPRFRHLGQHFLKPSDVANISISIVLHLVQSVGLLNA